MTAEKDPQVLVRMPAALKARLQESASAIKRSLTAEIIIRLQATFDSQDRQSDRLANESQTSIANAVAEMSNHPLADKAHLYRDFLESGEANTEVQRQILQALLRLPAEKQLALLMLLK